MPMHTKDKPNFLLAYQIITRFLFAVFIFWIENCPRGGPFPTVSFYRLLSSANHISPFRSRDHFLATQSNKTFFACYFLMFLPFHFPPIFSPFSFSFSAAKSFERHYPKRLPANWAS